MRNFFESPLIKDGHAYDDALFCTSGSAEVVRHNLAERKKMDRTVARRVISLSQLSDSHQFADDLR